MIEIRTGNEEIGFRTWQVNVTWQQRREVFAGEAIQVLKHGDGVTIEVDAGALLQTIGADAFGTTDDELWKTPYAHLQELALKVGLWLWTGVVPTAGGSEDPPSRTASGTADGEADGEAERHRPARGPASPNDEVSPDGGAGGGPFGETPSGSGPAESPTTSMPPPPASRGETGTDPTATPAPSTTSAETSEQ